jgi:hypothetical protein
VTFGLYRHRATGGIYLALGKVKFTEDLYQLDKFHGSVFDTPYQVVSRQVEELSQTVSTRLLPTLTLRDERPSVVDERTLKTYFLERFYELISQFKKASSELVFYVGRSGLWVRPIKMFNDGRFQKLTWRGWR